MTDLRPLPKVANVCEKLSTCSDNWCLQILYILIYFVASVNCRI
jgi:hypothetical protein